MRRWKWERERERGTDKRQTSVKGQSQLGIINKKYASWIRTKS